MVTSLAFVDVHAMFPIILRDYVTRIADTYITVTTWETVAFVCTTATIIVRTVMTVI